MDYNYFVKNPLKINILDKNLEITKTYIILGNIDETLYRNIIKHNEKHLKEFYGNSWASKLNIKSFDIKGFGDNNEQNDIYADIFNDDDIIEIDFDSVIINKDAITDSRDKKNIHENTNNDDIIYIKDICVYPFDTLYDIKKKIAIITDIQIYEQHFMTPITYDILLNNEIYGHYYNFNNIIHGVPYDQYMYDNRYNMSLKIYDNCKLLNETNEINIIPLNIFFNDKKSLLKIIKNEKEYADIIFHSFIFKYYPMINFETFIHILSDDENNIEIYKPIRNIGFNIKNEETVINTFKNIDINKRNAFIKSNYRTIINSISASVINNLSSINKTIDILDIFNMIEISKIKDLECIHIHKVNNTFSHNVIKINKNIIMNKHTTEFINKIKQDDNDDKNYLYLIFNDSKIKIYENGNIDIIILYDNGIEHIDKKNIINLIFDKLTNNTKLLSDYINIIKQAIEIGIIQYSIIQIKPINQYIFNLYKKALDYYYNHQFLLYIEKSSPNIFTYAINKMVYMFPPIETYTFVDQLPVTNINIKTYEFIIKNNILTINLTNIFHQESIYAIEILYNILFIIKDKLEVSIDKKISSKKLSHIDPVLFGYKSDDTYSRVCQKKYQPKVINEETYNNMKKEDKKNIINYPNITTGEQLYYQCPKDFPYMKFLKNYHPDGYCLPCCIKKDINTYTGYVDIHNTCLKTNMYPIDIKQDINVSSKKYIINYTSNINNTIEIGRIIELPILFKSLNIYLENENYYLTKITSGQFAVANILADSLAIDFNKMINIIISNLKENDKLFNVLLSINDIDYFNTNEDLIKYLNDILLSNINLSINIDWNKIFIKLANIFNIQFILFQDKGNLFLDNIKLIDGYSYIIIILNNNNYYPLWLFDNNANIKQKIFTKNDDYIIKYIQNIIDIITKKYNISSKITYNEIITYAKHKNIKISHYYNNIGICYSIGINNNISCPIDEDISHKNYKRNIFPKELPTYNDVLKFIQSYNDFIYSNNIKNYDTKDFKDYIREIKYINRTKMTNIIDYDKYGKYIRIIKLIINDKFISGILINSGIIYIKPINIIKFHSYDTEILNDTKKIMTRIWDINNKQKYYGLKYSFEEINKNFAKPHKLYKNDEYIQKSYQRYSYKLFISQLLNYYKKSNEPFIKEKMNYKQIEAFIITKYHLDDINKQLLEPYISEVLTNNKIETELSLFKIMNKQSIKNIISNTVKQIFIYGSTKINNMDFEDCYSNKQSQYCKNKKMIMEKNIVEYYTNLFSIDIQNPFKYDMINNLYTINKNNSYKTYPNEFIYII